MSKWSFVLVALLAATLGWCPWTSAAETRVVIVVGPSTHPPGSHEVAAGGKLLQHCLEHMTNVPAVRADLVDQWPKDDSVLEATSTIVFIGDIFPPQRLPETELILAKVDTLMRRGCGIACVHYATGLRAADVPADGGHPLLRWMGGYFATGCEHHRSVARVYPQVTITPATPEHPVSRGWREFTVSEEPYFNNYFGPDGNRPASNVTAFATSLLPPDAPKPEIVAWGVERADSGRGFGVVMPHFYKNWAQDDLRRLILNGIVWTAKREVPAEGVQTALPELASFGPESVEPAPRAPQPAAKKKKQRP